ncbi:MAG: dephospho-CoA kinase [Acidimicrobiales bacterium]|nr:dephospho-CoA kinase [Hyphomonadaceae bacterium]RZV44097.1 MAG: dephospho-CoA kinase [Acidimicrobiales bacterium]
MIIVGLTGSIGMGKTTTSRMFADAGAAVFDADACVHDLYAKGGKAVPIIRAVFPDAIVDDAVDRKILSKHLQNDPLHIQVLESFIHPLVGEARAGAVAAARAQGKKIIVFDVPLLFETGGDKKVDKIVVVSASADVQRKRVMSRPGMTKEKFKMILSRQTPDAEKRKRADYIVETDKGLDFARQQVQNIIKDLGGV